MRALFLGLIAVPAILLLTEVLAEQRDRLRYPAPGRISPGTNLHVLEKGTGAPAVILESGLTASSISWIQTQTGVARFARVIAYDRAGLGWSANGKSPLTLDQLLADLNSVVISIGTPVILVGHSFGGMLVSAFAHLHPNQIAGLVLVDPVSLATYAKLNPFYSARLERGIRLAKRGAILARFAIVRISLSMVARGSRKLPALIGRASTGKGSSILSRLAAEIAKLPPDTYGPIRSHWSRPASFRLMADYLRLLPQAAAQAQNLPIPAHIPVIVLSAESATISELAERDLWTSAHPASRHAQVANTTHWLQLDRPDLVTEAVRELALLIE